MKSRLKLIVSLAFTSLITSPTHAEEQWKHTLVPLYVWATGVQGTSQLGPANAPVGIEFRDALDHLDSSITLHYEANKGQWGVLADLYHLGLKPEGTLANKAPASITLTNNIYELGGIYRPAPGNGLDILFGLRRTDLKLEGRIGGNAGRTLTDQSWLDAFAGVRQNIAFNDKASLTMRGDIGAGDSDFVWNAALLFNYKFTKTVSMFGGYRWLSYDYESGNGLDRFAYDVTYQGPAVALSFDW